MLYVMLYRSKIDVVVDVVIDVVQDPYFAIYDCLSSTSHVVIDIVIDVVQDRQLGSPAFLIVL